METQYAETLKQIDDKPENQVNEQKSQFSVIYISVSIILIIVLIKVIILKKNKN